MIIKYDIYLLLKFFLYTWASLDNFILLATLKMPIYNIVKYNLTRSISFLLLVTIKMHI